MTKTIFTSLALAAALGLAACSEKAQDESAEAANAVATDVETTSEEAVADIEAATNEALAESEAAADKAGANLEAAGDRAANATGNALIEAGEEVKN